MIRKKSATATPLRCPCGGSTYASCCGPLHAGTTAADAQALMRSRYSAYVLRLERYLLDTWHDSTRPAVLDLTDQADMQWLGLEVIGFKPLDEQTASVEFVARYKIGGRAHRVHQISRFVRESGRWYYVEAA